MSTRVADGVKYQSVPETPSVGVTVATPTSKYDSYQQTPFVASTLLRDAEDREYSVTRISTQRSKHSDEEEVVQKVCSRDRLNYKERLWRVVVGSVMFIGTLFFGLSLILLFPLRWWRLLVLPLFAGSLLFLSQAQQEICITVISSKERELIIDDVRRQSMYRRLAIVFLSTIILSLLFTGCFLAIPEFHLK